MKNSTSIERSKLSQMRNLDKETLLQVETEKVEMTLNTDSAVASGLLIQRLTELYEDPIEASVRETTSNAIDAVTEAYSGDRPKVEITTPSSLNPVMSIKDNGIGMTYEDLKNIYSKYGASTKADDLDQVGAYGLGAKSPLAYGTEFTVTSIKDNQKTTIIVAREETTNYIKIVESVETDEKSGTAVSIPVSNYDIEKFIENIDKYRNTPLDKDIDLYINRELIENSDYKEISNNVLIHNSDEKVYSRVWIKPEDAVGLIADLSINDIKERMRFVIGGWAYSTPTARNGGYYRSGGKNIVVELKAGVVGFNSSRDAITDNERYEELEKLMIKYLSSDEFMEDIISAVNEMDIDSFKVVLSSLLKRHLRNISISNGKIEVNTGGRSSGFSRGGNYANINRKYEFEDFKHVDTGFNINEILKDTPRGNEDTLVIKEEKARYKKTVSNYILTNKMDSYSMFDETTISTINEVFDDVFKNNQEGSSLEVLMANLASMIYNSEDNGHLRLTFVTDISSEEQMNKLKSGRKTIVRLRNDGKDIDIYDSIIVYTKHSKKVIDKMISSARYENADILIRSVEDMLEDMTEYRANNRTKTTRVTNNDLSTNLQKITDTSGRVTAYEYSEVNEKEDNVIIAVRDGFVSTNSLNMIINWYCNENKVSPDDFNLFVSKGFHKANDVDLLLEVGDVYRYPQSGPVGRSKKTENTVDNNVAGMNALRDNDPELEVKSIVRLLSGITGSSPRFLVSDLEDKIVLAEKLAEISGDNFEGVPTKELKQIEDYGNSYKVSGYSGWRLDDEAVEHLLESIKSDKYDSIHNISVGIDRRITINSNSEYTLSHADISSGININATEEAYENKDNKSPFYKLTRLRAKGYVEFVNELVIDIRNLIN